MTYNGPQLPVYKIAIIVPKVPIDNNAPPRRPAPQPRATPAPTYSKPSVAVDKTRINFENYMKMCEGLDYLEAKEREPFPQ